MKKVLLSLVLLSVCWCGVVSAKEYTVEELMENLKKIQVGAESSHSVFEDMAEITNTGNTISIKGKEKFEDIIGSISLEKNLVKYHVDERIFDEEFIKNASESNLSRIQQNDDFILINLLYAICDMKQINISENFYFKMPYDTSAEEFLNYGVTKKEITYDIMEKQWKFISEFTIDLDNFKIKEKWYTLDELIENLKKVPIGAVDAGESSFGVYFGESVEFTTEGNTIYMKGKDSYKNVNHAITLEKNLIKYHVDERIHDEEFRNNVSSEEYSKILTMDKYMLMQLLSAVSYMKYDGKGAFYEMLYETPKEELLQYGITKKEVTYEIGGNPVSFLTEFTIDLDYFKVKDVTNKTTDANENKKEDKKEEFENPETGETIPFDMLSIGLLGIFILFFLRKANKLNRI